jgi:DNA-binding NarL/FixJ family response regulator
MIVDDHAGFRVSARALLERQGFDVVADVEDGKTALEATARLHPDVVLLDVQLPGMDGFEVASLLANMSDAPRVVLISSRRRSAYEVRLRAAPIAGFLSKNELSGEALAALL